jgi:hypothetical protein
MRSGDCGTDFFFSFNIGGVLGNYAMKFEIQSGGGLNFCVALPFINVLPFETYPLMELFKFI